MGLTFQQKFYQIPEEVFLIFDAEMPTSPLGIIEIPEDKEKASELKLLLELYPKYCLRVKKINFNELITSGYKLLQIAEINKEEYGL